MENVEGNLWRRCSMASLWLCKPAPLFEGTCPSLLAVDNGWLLLDRLGELVVLRHSQQYFSYICDSTYNLQTD